MVQDRRIQKTRQALRQALSQMIEEKPYTEITVRDLVERADIARSSFYVHFRDKDDLLISGFEEIGVMSSDDLFEESDRESGYPDFAIVLFRGATHWKAVAQACLCGDANNVAAVHMRNMLVIKSREWLRSIAPTLPEADLEPTAHYLAGALLELLSWWVRNDFPYPAKAMSDIFNRLAISGLQSLLDLAPDPRSDGDRSS